MVDYIHGSAGRYTNGSADGHETVNTAGEVDAPRGGVSFLSRSGVFYGLPLPIWAPVRHPIQARG